MTRVGSQGKDRGGELGLNAPFGARCFMTAGQEPHAEGQDQRLNAPFGARCFMTVDLLPAGGHFHHVLMHRLALGAL